MALPTGYILHEGADTIAAHAYLTTSYWAKGRDLDTVRRSIDGSFVISIQHNGQQVGMARAVTDFATFAYLQDVYVLEGHEGKGLAKAMVNYLLNHRRLAGIERWALFTKDAQTLYGQLGFYQYPKPERMMIRDESMKPA